MPIQYRIAQAIPGRLRLRVDLRGDFQKEGMVKALEDFLRCQKGVFKVNYNRHCRSLTVQYNPVDTSGDELMRLISKVSVETLKLRQRNPEHQKPEAEGFSWLPFTLSSVALILGTFTESSLMPFLLLGASIPIFSRAFVSVTKEKKLNVDVLDASATALLSFQRQYTTAAAMVWLVSLGDFIRNATVRQSHRAIEGLFDGHDLTAWVVRDGKKILIKAEGVQIGDEVVVYPGELIPVDGIVLEGKATVDQKILTGESLPVEKEKGNKVFAGTVVREGKVYLRAEKVGAETTQAKIIQLVNQAPTQETRVQNYAEHFANRLVPWSFLAAGTSFAITGNSNPAASLLIVDYGTGIRIAAPTTVLSSMTRAARQGILIKGGRYLEKLAAIDAVIFDKTGTLTLGEPEIVDIIPYGKKNTPEWVLSLAAASEDRITHPTAEAIVRAAKQRGIDIPERESSEYTIGLGIEACVGGSVVMVGCHRFMALKKVPMKRASRDIARLDGGGASPLYVALDGKLIGLLVYTDPIRPEASSVIRALSCKGIKQVVMLTGDHPAIAEKVARTLGISRFIADVFPGEKAEIVRSLQKEGYTVAVVGDGINDTPALVQADVGISVKGGADVARETAHVSFLEGNLWKIPQAIDIARESLQLIQQNWSINFYPNTAAIILAVLGVLNPIGTTIVSNGSAILASCNALRPLISNPEASYDYCDR
ncbi:MAG: heavy metal translocating P-type ATPase [bacterium]